MKGAWLLINNSPLDTGEKIKDFENNLKRNTMLPSYSKLLRTFKSFVECSKQLDLRIQDRDYISTNFEYLFDSN